MATASPAQPPLDGAASLPACDAGAPREPEREPAGACEAAEAGPGEGAARCGVCRQAAPKYTCPACGVRTCSLGCVKGHKASSGCTGRRDRAALVKLPQFTERQLLSDVGFLDEVGRESESARRRRPRPPPFRLPHRLHVLRQEAKKRKVELEILSPGMHKREANRTRFEPGRQRLLWHVEWHFVAGGLRIHDREVPEGSLLADALMRHLGGPRRGFKEDEKLQPYKEAGLQALTLALRHARCPMGRVRHHRLAAGQSLASQLAGKRVVEFPTLLVLLPSELPAYRFDDAPDSPAGEEAESSKGEEGSSSEAESSGGSSGGSGGAAG